MKTIGVIPARFASTRFPGKVLALIHGKPMIEHVWQSAKGCRELDDLLIACDDQKVLKAAQGFGAKAVMTRPEHPSGSDRIAEAVGSLKFDIVVNIQGDEPFIKPQVIDDLVKALKNDANASVATVVKEIKTDVEINNPNVVKVVIDKNNY